MTLSPYIALVIYLAGAAGAAWWHWRHLTRPPVSERLAMLRDVGVPIPPRLLVAATAAAWPVIWPLNLYWSMRDPEQRGQR